MELSITLGLLLSLVAICWIAARVFRGGAPNGESSSRADINASGAYGTELIDNMRGKQKD